MLTFHLLLILLASTITEPQRSFLDDFIVPYRALNSVRLNLIGSLKQRNRSYLNNDKIQDPVPDSTVFPCPVEHGRSATRPQSVHQLRPGDIDVIGAIGDSLTVGIGTTAKSILDTFYDERGTAFAIGGQADWRKYLTLPNILKEFNPNLVGYSLKASLSIQDEAQLNVAEPGAMSADTIHMAKELIKRIKLDPRINLAEDWKMITVFIGCNDFCANLCYLERPKSALRDHRNDLVKALRLLRDNLPRTFVNLVPPPNLKVLVELKTDNPICYFTYRIECPCLYGLPNARKKPMLYQLMTEWQKVDVGLGSLEEFDRNDFTVVVQPFGLNYTLPKIPPDRLDETYLSGDCFHWSQKMQARIANDLWNTIMEPVGGKSQDGRDVFTRFNCPNDDHPYIFTRRNSPQR